LGTLGDLPFNLDLPVDFEAGLLLSDMPLELELELELEL